jgi:hypothetical protein
MLTLLQETTERFKLGKTKTNKKQKTENSGIGNKVILYTIG